MISNLKSVEDNQEYLKSIIGGRGENQIDWKNSVGCEIKYKYVWNGECSEGVLKIVKYENEYVYFDKGYGKGVRADSIIKGNLGGIINLIINKTPKMLLLGVSAEDSKKYTYNSHKKITVVCPDCGKTKEVAPYIIYRTNSIGCLCSDGVSYPEKLMISVLNQTNVEHKCQYRIDKFRYDVYLPNTNTIIELHGGQHGQFIKNGELTLVKRTKGFSHSKRDEIKIDADKCWTAYKNKAIKHYIVICCEVSDLEYIKSNIINSELNKLFKNKDIDLNKVDWIECEKFSRKNKVKEICSYYKEHTEIFTSDLAKKFNINKNTIIEYLKQGTKLGWCEYNAKEEMRRNSKRNGVHRGKPVSQFLEGEFVKTYPSAAEAGRQTDIASTSILKCCNGKYKTAGGYTWKFE